MKFFNPILILLGIFYLQWGNAQCFSINENDFPAVSVSADDTNPTSAVVTSSIDAWDAAGNAPGSDGTMDVMISLQAFVTNPNPGTCTGNYEIGGAVGPGGGALGTTSDMANSTSDGCVCQNGYVVATIDFMGGLSSEAGGFDLDWSSMNGSSEGYEYLVGYVSGGTTTVSVTPADIANYCNAQYVGGTDMATFLGATGPGTFGADDLNAIANDCATSASGGEDTGSGSGPDSTSDAISTGGANLGLAPTDIITQVTLIYGLSTAPSTDCDGDSNQDVDTNPSASWGSIEICPPPPPCGFDGAFELVEECGVFDIVINTVTPQDAGQLTFDIEYSDDAGATWTTASTAVALPFVGPLTLDVNLTADGSTEYLVRFVDGVDPNCNDEFGPLTAPAANTPLIISYPAN